MSRDWAMKSYARLLFRAEMQGCVAANDPQKTEADCRYTKRDFVDRWLRGFRGRRADPNYRVGIAS